jgi:hypothetical protein
VLPSYDYAVALYNSYNDKKKALSARWKDDEEFFRRRWAVESEDSRAEILKDTKVQVRRAVLNYFLDSDGQPDEALFDMVVPELNVSASSSGGGGVVELMQRVVARKQTEPKTKSFVAIQKSILKKAEQIAKTDKEQLSMLRGALVTFRGICITTFLDVLLNRYFKKASTKATTWVDTLRTVIGTVLSAVILTQMLGMNASMFTAKGN